MVKLHWMVFDNKLWRYVGYRSNRENAQRKARDVQWMNNKPHHTNVVFNSEECRYNIYSRPLDPNEQRY